MPSRPGRCQRGAPRRNREGSRRDGAATASLCIGCSATSYISPDNHRRLCRSAWVSRSELRHPIHSGLRPPMRPRSHLRGTIMANFGRLGTFRIPDRRALQPHRHLATQRPPVESTVPHRASGVRQRSLAPQPPHTPPWHAGVEVVPQVGRAAYCYRPTEPASFCKRCMSEWG